MRKGSHHTPETQAKMRDAWTRRTPPTREQLEPMISANRGRPKSEEHKRKLSEQKIGELNPQWGGGRRVISKGYIMVLKHDHPCADKDGYVLEHRIVMEQKLGRILEKEEVVHHINGDTGDNREDNLSLFPDVASHTSFHRQESIARSRESG